MAVLRQLRPVAWLWILAGALGIAAILAHGLGGRLMRTGRPVEAVALSPSVDTLSQAAERLAAAGAWPLAAASARAALSRSPIDLRALRVLGLAQEKLGHPQAGADIMNVAARGGWRDTPTQVWLIEQAMRTGDVTTLAQRADALARRNQSPDMVYATLRIVSSAPEVRPALIERLAARPDWRALFFLSLRQARPEQIDGLVALVREMRRSEAPVTSTELFALGERLIELDQPARARMLWAEASGRPTSALIDDGGFERLAKRPADMLVPRFEWQFAETSGSASVEPGPWNSSPALRLTHDGFSLSRPISQLLLLAPARYRVTARVKVDPDFNAAGYGLSLRCPNGLELVATQPVESAGIIRADFTVPASCPAQNLALTTFEGQARTASELWLDDVRVSRLP
ncbi:hypothetical protein ABC347_16435 [Sphingomonas sp. 1P06PA]|uniref:hypothetical protein n=1 Tax=Sphingomonas sp. 1P06PA TaxID=554121 RepID=UPI0039A41E74